MSLPRLLRPLRPRSTVSYLILTVLTDTELSEEEFVDFLVRHGWSRIAAVGMEWVINGKVSERRKVREEAVQDEPEGL